MNAHRLRALPRGGSFFPPALALLFSAVAVFGFGVARSQREETPADERRFEDTVAAHVPVKLKLRNEQKLKDLKNKGWARDFEVEVKNTGTKPIYFLQLTLAFPEPELNILGHRQALTMSYGRSRIGIPGNVAEPDDVPILPGETITLKLKEKEARAYEMFRDSEGRPDPKKVEIEVVYVFFGDGTAFIGRKGKFESWPTKKRSENAPRPPGPAGGCKPSPRFQTAASPGRYFKAFDPTRPASLLRVNFYPPEEEAAPAPAPRRDDCGCQSLQGCVWGTLGDPSCPCDEDFVSEIIAVVFGGGCANSGARCWQVITQSKPCPTRFNGVQTCTWDDPTGGTCFETDPTPTPTPFPTPSSTPPSTPTPTPPPCSSPNPGADCCFEDIRTFPGVPPFCVWNCEACEPGTTLNGGCVSSRSRSCPEGYEPSSQGAGVCCPQAAGTGVEGFGGRTGWCDIDLPPSCTDGIDNDGDGLVDGSDPGCVCPSPVLIDLNGDGFALTGADSGVLFDLNGDGTAERLAWTRGGSDDSWLALDRDGDGMIDGGRELFGNYTPQPVPPAGQGRNGFLALAEFDKPGEGGNADGVIDARDAVFARLRLWRDSDHDGVSRPEELHALAALDVARLHLDYKESKRTDEHGNRFRYRAKVDGARGAKAGRWAWDVFLVSTR
ncbi:MAG TPA: VCBS repeat-containing protein [Pyrinomonadaceae bacterium]|jgi:hypothetical protein|nr:VCBS repeat-containing protein [Pyrinomonadaceae bacterium]